MTPEQLPNVVVQNNNLGTGSDMPDIGVVYRGTVKTVAGNACPD